MTASGSNTVADSLSQVMLMAQFFKKKKQLNELPESSYIIVLNGFSGADAMLSEQHDVSLISLLMYFSYINKVKKCYDMI